MVECHGTIGGLHYQQGYSAGQGVSGFLSGRPRGVWCRVLVIFLCLLIYFGKAILNELVYMEAYQYHVDRGDLSHNNPFNS